MANYKVFVRNGRKRQELAMESLLGTLAPQYRYFKETSTLYRAGIRSGQYVIDKALTTTGFSGVENTDWSNVSNLE
jgi:hypothetical protein